jgi:hypothetical protein
MATDLTRITAYVEPDVWQRFREGCLVRHISASKQLGVLVIDQLAAWEKEGTTKTQTSTK